jgi:hypothetical protein
MALSDCDAPATPTPTRAGTDLIDRLSLLRPNLVRFNRFTFTGGASAVDPFTDPPVTGASSDQLRAVAMPGGSATVVAQILDLVYGAATVGMNGGAYNMSFDAYLIGGATSATLRSGFRSSVGGAITGISDESYAVTDVRQTFAVEHISSDDPNWFAAAPNNAAFKFFVNSALEIPAGSILYITNFQLQNDDFYAPYPIDLPWRPARGEDNLAVYSEYVLNTSFAELAAKPNQKVMSNHEGVGLILSPVGPVSFPVVTATTYLIGGSEGGKALICENAAGCVVTFTPESVHQMRAGTCVTVRVAPGAGAVSIAEGVGVNINPRFAGTFDLDGEGDYCQVVYRGAGTDTWDMY